MKIRSTTILSLLLLLLLFWGGLGLILPTTAAMGLVFCVMVFVFWDLLGGGRLAKPPGFEFYLVFLVVILWQFLTGRMGAQGSYLLMLFLGGGAFWLVFSNLPKRLSEQLANLIVILGLVFGALLVGFMALGRIPEGGWNLYLFSSIYRNHNHIGDLWALVGVVAVYRIIKARRWYWWALGSATIFFLAISLSRSAYAAFFAGMTFLAYREDWFKKYAKLLIPVLVVPILLFLGAGLFKTTLYSRLYFIQGVLGVVKYPLGAGLGNFAQISNEMGSLLKGNAQSALAHNIVLEVIVGAGALGIFFVIWLAKALRELLRRGDILYSSLFVALTVNFCFDTTYYIPAMIWLWFILLGLAQERK